MRLRTLEIGVGAFILTGIFALIFSCDSSQWN